MNKCLIPISLGELYDKFSILLIKSENILEQEKLLEVNKEISFLEPFVNKFNLNQEMCEKIKKVNEKLWTIEDSIRLKESNQEFDEEFIALARSVYTTNDERAKIKNEINKILNSEINEIKSYVKY